MKLHIFLLLLSGAVPVMQAQTAFCTLILGNTVGETIDSSERAEYHLFPRYARYDSIRVLRDGDDKCHLKLFFRSAAGGVRDTLLPCPDDEIRVSAALVQHYAKISKDPSSAYSAPIKVTVVCGDSSSEEYIALPKGRPLPFHGNAKPDYFEGVTKFTASVQYNAGTIEMKELEKALSDMEKKFAEQGYPLPPHKPLANFFSSFGVGIEMTLPRGFALRTEVGTGREESMDVSLMTAEVLYLIPQAWSKQVSLSAGIGWAGFHIEYGNKVKYHARISPINQSGGYNQLEDVNISGSKYLNGLTAQAQCDVRILSWLSIGAFTRFFFFAPLEVLGPDNTKVNLSINPVSWGISFTLQKD